MSTLVAGGCGFIGSHLVRRLLSEGEEVVIFDLYPNTMLIKDIADKLTIVRGDSTCLVDILHAVKDHGVRDIYHLIGLLADVSQEKPGLALKVNVESTLNFLEAARIMNLGKIIFTSSSAVYDPKELPPVGESVAPRPTSVYGATKVMSEFYGMHYNKLFGVDFVALRFTTLYGFGKSGGSTGICSKMIEQSAMGEPVRVDVADAVTDWLYIKDAINSLLLARSAKNPQQRIYNIGAGTYSVRQVADVVRQLIPAAQIQLEAKRTFPWPPSYTWVKAEEELGYKPLFTIEGGVRDFIEECKARGRNRT
jgi:nucleoside-diphosphate-sugar epimerase